MWEESGKILGGEECVCEGVSCVRFVHGCYQEPGNQGQPYRPRLVGIWGERLNQKWLQLEGEKSAHTKHSFSRRHGLKLGEYSLRGYYLPEIKATKLNLAEKNKQTKKKHLTVKNRQIETI